MMTDHGSRVSAAMLPPVAPHIPMFMIVEDNKLNRRLLRDIVRIQGWRSVEAERADEAWQLLRMIRIRGEMPTAILLDIRLPDQSGLEFVRELKADPVWREVPVIAVTALAMKHDDTRILDAGCDAYVAKPISVSSLLETVQNCLPSGTLAL
jgi:two-component system, cell cycle response regulator DivK